MIQLTDLRKTIDQKTVIDIPSLVVPTGQVHGIVGGVDSGLDILFELLTGSLPPTTGSIRLAEVDPHTQHIAFSQKVGVVFREDNFYQRLSTLSNLQFYCKLHHLPKKRAIEVLEQIGLGDQRRSLAGELSTGQARLLSFGRAILHQPVILLLAEPLARCDEVSVKLLSRQLLAQAECGVATLVMVENPANLESLCGTIYHFENGRITSVSKPREEQQTQRPFMIPCRTEDKVILIDPADILYITAQDDRTYLQTAEGRLPTQFSLTELEDRLSRRGFFRAHRGYLVNLQQVKEVIPYTRDSFSLRLKDAAGTKIPMSKTAERELRELLGY